jgi:Ni/Co efflux regulator RcnB
VLPRNVIYHNVPPERIYAYALPPPPSGHRYVRVANDILLIAIGTGLIVDAIQDISYR